MDHTQLRTYCKRVYQAAGKATIQADQASTGSVKRYYTQSAFWYRKFHSDEGAMHLPIAGETPDSHHSKLRYQANAVHELIVKHGYTHILELGCGMGFNTRHLAEQHPDKQFTGMDLTPVNVQYARKKASDLPNTTFVQGDFNQLEQADLGEQRFDLIFAVETLCYATDVTAVLGSLSKRLTDNGRIVLFDGYEQPDIPEPTDDYELEAYALFNWGFAVPHFQPIETIRAVEAQSDLMVERVTDYTQQVLPNYLAFQKGSMRGLRLAPLLRIMLVLRLFPLALVKQLSAGAFGPHFIERGFVGYYQVILAKEASNASR